MTTRPDFDEYLKESTKKTVPMTRQEIEHFRLTLCRQYGVSRRDIKMMSDTQYIEYMRKKYGKKKEKHVQHKDKTKRKICCVLDRDDSEPRLIYTLSPYKLQEEEEDVDSDEDY